MKITRYLIACTAMLLSCGKSNENKPVTTTTQSGTVKETVETNNGITYKSFVSTTASTNYKGILVMGSGNNEDDPTAGALDGGPENDLCEQAAKNGYVAAIVQYRQTPGTKDWNASAHIVGQDYNNTITALSTEFGVDKNKSVVGGYSYASFMLLTNSAYFTDLTYCKGLLAPCGGTGATDFKIPIFSIACKGGNEGDYSGADLYNHINANSTIKAASIGITDNSCDTHCGGNWTAQLYAQMVKWMP